jgi:excisionase family DNA binding protein
MREEMTLLTVSEAADRLGLSPVRTRALAASGELRGEKIGRDWVFKEADVTRLAKKERPRPGRRPTR